MISIRVLLIFVIALAATSCTLLPTPAPIVIRETVEVTREIEITSTPPPTPTATSIPATILADDFDDGPGGWRLDTTGDYSAEIRDGMLVIDVLSPNLLYRVGHRSLDFLNSPFDLEIRLDFRAGPPESYAAIDFRYIDEYNFATFFVNGAGLVAAGAVIDGQFYEHLPWIRLSAVSRDSNVIRLIDRGERVIAYANGELLFDYPFPYQFLAPGSLGISVATYDEGNATWAFDNLSIREVAR